MVWAADRKTNHLLAALPDAEWPRWLPQLERVELPLGQVLYESGNTLSHAYFPMIGRVKVLSQSASELSGSIAESETRSDLDKRLRNLIRRQNEIDIA